MQPWTIITAVTITFTIPVLASNYYTLILLVSSLRYPKTLGEKLTTSNLPIVSVLIATYNEKFVVSKTLDAIRTFDYPRSQLQVVVADDSTDETRELIDAKIRELKSSGISAQVSRRETREGFKSAALNKAAPLLEGEYVLLLDADSTVTPDVVSKGIAVLQDHPGASFVSYRVGHYNRNQNIITRLFALSLDLGDTLTKMGSYRINGPFSFQGGYTLISRQTLQQAGFWAPDTVTDDADLSCRIYAMGGMGIYLSNVRIFGEDPSTLGVWKKQQARIAQGWAKCISKHWRRILGSRGMPVWKRVALLLVLLGPLSALGWLVTSFTTALSLVLGLNTPANSVFTNPIYIILVSLPVVSYFLAAAYSLRLQKIDTVGNLLLIPLISYPGYSMLTALSVGFLSGILGRTGFFFRTPKSGSSKELTKTDYYKSIRLDRVAVVEAVLAASGLVLGVFSTLKGVWFLGLTLLGFGVLTLKSMNLTQALRKPTAPTETDEASGRPFQ